MANRKLRPGSPAAILMGHHHAEGGSMCTGGPRKRYAEGGHARRGYAAGGDPYEEDDNDPYAAGENEDMGAPYEPSNPYEEPQPDEEYYDADEDNAQAEYDPDASYGTPWEHQVNADPYADEEYGSAPHAAGIEASPTYPYSSSPQFEGGYGQPQSMPNEPATQEAKAAQPGAAPLPGGNPSSPPQVRHASLAQKHTTTTPQMRKGGSRHKGIMHRAMGGVGKERKGYPYT